MSEVWRVAAGAVAGIHFGFLAYFVLGGFLAWRWPRSVVGHLVAVGWGLAGLAVPVWCPLTGLEDELRRRAGEPALAGGFIDQYVAGVIYPEWFTPALRWLVVTAILVSWLGLYARWRRRAGGEGGAGRVTSAPATTARSAPRR